MTKPSTADPVQNFFSVWSTGGDGAARDFLNSLTQAGIDALFSSAVHSRRLFELSEAVMGLGGDNPVPGLQEAAVTANRCCHAIRRRNAEVLYEISTSLTAVGIESARTEDEPLPNQIHAVRIDIHANDVLAALRVLGSGGFQGADAWLDIPAEVLTRTRAAVALSSECEPSTRVALRWRKPWRRRYRRVFEPELVDLVRIRWPVQLWPLYYLNKPVRKAAAGLSVPGFERDPGLFLGTPRDLIAPLLDAAGVVEGDTIYDLGCGDGRILIEACRLRRCRGVGIEIDGDLAKLARETVSEQGLDDRIRIVNGDSADADTSDANVVFIFLPPNLAAMILPHALRQLRPGARCVIHEQLRLPESLTPDRSLPVFGESSVTVANLWSR